MKKICKMLAIVTFSFLFLMNIRAEEERYIIVPVDPFSAKIIEKDGVYSFVYGDGIVKATCFNGQPEEEIHATYTTLKRVVAFKYAQSGNYEGGIDWDGAAIYADGNYDYVKWLPHTVTETLILGQCQPCSVYENNEFIPGIIK